VRPRQFFVNSKKYRIMKVFLQKFSCMLIGALANLRLPAFVMKPVFLVYSLIFRIDNSQFQINLKGLVSFNMYFTRQFRNGMRSFNGSVASPAEGRIYASGKMENNRLLQIKHQTIHVKNLIGFEPEKLRGFVSIYLSPANYHRVHAPCDMEIQNIRYVPGAYYSVAPRFARSEKVYLKNERIVLTCDTPKGKMVMVLIAALNVGNICLVSLDDLAPQGKPARNIEPKNGPVRFKQGDEIAHFNIGSSVVLLCEEEFPESDQIRNVLLGDELMD